MADAVIDGITTHYETIGSGPPLLMFSPGGFDATIDKWRTQSVYARFKPLQHLPARYTCIVFDRRESGESGGRVELITWSHYMAQGKGLLEHLNIPRAHVMGACMGCCPAVALAVANPEMVSSLVLYWPVGGAAYRINGHARLAQHAEYVEQHGLTKVVELVTSEGKTFNQDPRGGLWASVIRRDPEFAEMYGQYDVQHYLSLIEMIGAWLFDRDTAPGAEPESMMELDVPAFIVPGRDKSHATSAARYLEECLPRAEYWDVPVEGQTEETVPPRLLDFLDRQAVSA
jgi:pimeloyl-ACP methyl ester carboxylesterase